MKLVCILIIYLLCINCGKLNGALKFLKKYNINQIMLTYLSKFDFSYTGPTHNWGIVLVAPYVTVRRIITLTAVNFWWAENVCSQGRHAFVAFFSFLIIRGCQEGFYWFHSFCRVQIYCLLISDASQTIIEFQLPYLHRTLIIVYVKCQY